MTNEKVEKTLATINRRYGKKQEIRQLFEDKTRERKTPDGEIEVYSLDVPYHTGNREYKVPQVVLWQIENDLWDKSRFKWRYFRSIGLKIALVAFFIGLGGGVWVTLKLSSQATI